MKDQDKVELLYPVNFYDFVFYHTLLCCNRYKILYIGLSV